MCVCVCVCVCEGIYVRICLCFSALSLPLSHSLHTLMHTHTHTHTQIHTRLDYLYLPITKHSSQFLPAGLRMHYLCLVSVPLILYCNAHTRPHARTHTHTHICVGVCACISASSIYIYRRSLVRASHTRPVQLEATACLQPINPSDTAICPILAPRTIHWRGPRQITLAAPSHYHQTPEAVFTILLAFII